MKKFIVAVAVLLVGALGFRVARPAYRHWKEERFVARAQQALLGGDLHAATLSARQALEANPSNVEACRILARICEATGSPAALQWRQKILRLQHDSVTNRLDFARSAIGQGNIAEMARLAYTRQPGNESVASTHAFALSVQGKNKEALAVLEALKPGQLERPTVALYYGAVLVPSDKSDKARKYLAIAETAHLLPEEKALLEDLKKRVTDPAIAN